MNAENQRLVDAVSRLRTAILADRHVDIEEANLLLAFAERHADNPQMAEFVPFLKQILADGVVDETES